MGIQGYTEILGFIRGYPLVLNGAVLCLILLYDFLFGDTVAQGLVLTFYCLASSWQMVDRLFSLKKKCCFFDWLIYSALDIKIHNKQRKRLSLCNFFEPMQRLMHENGLKP